MVRNSNVNRKFNCSRKNLNYDPEEVRNPALRYKESFNPEAYFRKISQYIGEDTFGAGEVDFFYGTIDD